MQIYYLKYIYIKTKKAFNLSSLSYCKGYEINFFLFISPPPFIKKKN